jgi:hypothetical protein
LRDEIGFAFIRVEFFQGEKDRLEFTRVGVLKIKKALLCTHPCKVFRDGKD